MNDEIITSYLLGKKAGGGSPAPTPTYQDKEITITTNGEQTITADTGYDALSSVEITTNVPQPSGKITITQNGTDIDVSSYATADVNVPAGADLSEYFESSITVGTQAAPSWQLVLKKIPSLTLSGTSLQYAFYKIPNNVSIPNIDASNCTDFQNAFQETSKTQIDMSGWTFPSSLTTALLFQNCFNSAKATNINLSSLGTIEINGSYKINFTRAFAFNTNLKTVNLSNLNLIGTNSTLDGSNMFNGCTALEQIDMSSLDFSRFGNNTSSMFNNVPTNCLILVKDQTQKDWFTTKFPSLTNVQIKGA